MTPTRAPLDLAPTPAWPPPHPRCTVCAALAKQRVAAFAMGDFSKVSDCNVEIRAHQDPHTRRGR